MTEPKARVTYKPSDEVDFVIVGSGAAGGVMAKELATNGFRVVVLEQGPYLRPADFSHDEVKVFTEHQLTNNPAIQPTTFRKTPEEKARKQHSVMYGRCVGGSSVHFTANYWRFHEIDFIEHSKVGDIPGAALADWPITYADLEPYYTKVEWEIGVSGLAGASPFDPPRSKPYPMPPLPVKGNGVVFERAARKLGYHPFPAPMAILSQPRAGIADSVSVLVAKWGRSRRLWPRLFLWRKRRGVARSARTVMCTRSRRTRTGERLGRCISTQSETPFCKKPRR
jgi:choline dehydrogenase-like flavoprotein